MPGLTDVLQMPSTKANLVRESSFRQNASGNLEMVACMDHCVTGGLVEKGKPNLDLFLLAVDSPGGLRPEEVTARN
jgi:beta-phosphoglucomutase-like phosphatase (HAD superfamily)